MPYSDLRYSQQCILAQSRKPGQAVMPSITSEVTAVVYGEMKRLNLGPIMTSHIIEMSTTRAYIHAAPHKKYKVEFGSTIRHSSADVRKKRDALLLDMPHTTSVMHELDKAREYRDAVVDDQCLETVLSYAEEMLAPRCHKWLGFKKAYTKKLRSHFVREFMALCNRLGQTGLTLSVLFSGTFSSIDMDDMQRLDVQHLLTLQEEHFSDFICRMLNLQHLERTAQGGGGDDSSIRSSSAEPWHTGSEQFLRTCLSV